MLRLTSSQLTTLEASSYRRDCGRDHDTCTVCGDLLHAGQLIYHEPGSAAHTRCVLPGLPVHQLFELLCTGGR